VAGKEVPLDQREEVRADLVGQRFLVLTVTVLAESVFCFHRPRVWAMG